MRCMNPNGVVSRPLVSVESSSAHMVSSVRQGRAHDEAGFLMVHHRAGAASRGCTPLAKRHKKSVWSGWWRPDLPAAGRPATTSSARSAAPAAWHGGCGCGCSASRAIRGGVCGETACGEALNKMYCCRVKDTRLALEQNESQTTPFPATSHCMARRCWWRRRVVCCGAGTSLGPNDKCGKGIKSA